MSERNPRLIDLLPGDLGNASTAMDQQLREGAGKLDGAAVAWDFARDSAQQELAKALDVDLIEFVARGWATVQRLKEYADRGRHPPDEVNVVNLGDHDIATESYPTIDVTIGTLALPVIRFTLKLSAHFESLILTIRDGAIRKVQSGNCKVSVELLLGGASLLPPMQTPKLVLPGKLEFAEGIRIA